MDGRWSSRHGRPWGKITEAWTWKRRGEMRKELSKRVLRENRDLVGLKKEGVGCVKR